MRLITDENLETTLEITNGEYFADMMTFLKEVYGEDEELEEFDITVSVLPCEVDICCDEDDEDYEEVEVKADPTERQSSNPYFSQPTPTDKEVYTSLKLVYSKENSTNMEKDEPQPDAEQKKPVDLKSADSPKNPSMGYYERDGNGDSGFFATTASSFEEAATDFKRWLSDRRNSS